MIQPMFTTVFGAYSQKLDEPPKSNTPVTASPNAPFMIQVAEF